jgi:class 3 adenylate cyclase
MLRDMVLNTNWEEKNLPSDLNIRIALHAGPVFIGEDPVLNRENAYGANVNRAARIEPVTIPGQIYASDQFTANLLVETKSLYQFEYVGNLELPKAFGNQDLYNIKMKAN